MILDFGYVAGIIDAEGSIFMSKVIAGGNVYYYPRVSVSNTNKEILSVLESYGGKVRCQPMKGKLGNKQVRVWALQKQNSVLSLIQNIGPYLIVKRLKAMEVLGSDIINVSPSWSYVAGVLDGDGSVSVVRNNYKYWRVDIRLTTVCRELASSLKIMCGGNFCEVVPHGISRRTQFLWQSYRQDRNRNILEQILPYVIEKQVAVRRALVCLDDLELKR